MSDETKTPEPVVEPEAQPTPAEPTFTQEQLNALLTKERKATERKVRKEMQSKMAQVQPEQKQEPTADAVQLEQQAKFLERLDAIEAKSAAAESANAFALETSGITLTESDKAIAKTLFEHNKPAFDQMMKDRRAADRPPEPQGDGFDGLGAPNPVPEADRENNPFAWQADDIARMRKDGTFLPKLKAFRNTLPGSSGGLFPAKNPGG